MVLQEVIRVPDSIGTEGKKKKEESMISTEEATPTPPTRPYQPPVPYPQQLAWSKLRPLEPKFARFPKILRRIYACSPFLDALKNAPAQFKFLRELLSKKGDPGDIPVAPRHRILQHTSIGAVAIETAGS